MNNVPPNTIKLGRIYPIKDFYSKHFFGRDYPVYVEIRTVLPQVDGYYVNILGEPEWSYLIMRKMIAPKILLK